jgi:hypothetical protein
VCDGKITMNSMDGYGKRWSLPAQKYLSGDTMENYEESGRIAGSMVNLGAKSCLSSEAEQGIHQHSHIITLEHTAVLITTATINISDPTW